MTTVIPIEIIEKNILLIRGERVMLDSDLEELYGAYPRQRRYRAKGRSIWFAHPQAKLALPRRKRNRDLMLHCVMAGDTVGLPSEMTTRGKIFFRVWEERASKRTGLSGQSIWSDGAHDMCYKVATSLEARTALRLQQ